MLCIWWDQLGVAYYELLQPNERITGRGVDSSCHVARQKQHSCVGEDRVWLHLRQVEDVATCLRACGLSYKTVPGEPDIGAAYKTV
ncbi:hypothetical protein LAZ67_12003589 [Cordylochernes scorpioides]|uniref:Uncharacterized protein n=1 Tax=Cordylochernes scorpioides TaxID=51811 RepID=A0ABY6L7D0_9ARAC|nr:hypothetical protein LAZ67_12003589 [Cordylochernes scorpioides]